MANVFGIHSISNSITTFLQDSYESSTLNGVFDCRIRPISSGELAAGADDIDSTLSLYLYRISINEHLRNIQRETGPGRFEVPLALDLHYLLTAWYDRSDAEHTVMSWAMQQFYEHPMLNAASLSSEAAWRDGDVIQLIPSELTNEDVMRIWDALHPTYRLSFSYTARVVRIESGVDSTPDSEVVVSNRFHFDEVETIR